MRVRTALGGFLGIGAIFALMALAPLAGAAYDPLGSGRTTLSLDKTFLTLLKRNGIKLAATAPAKLEGSAVSFPVSGGKFDPTSANGTVEHSGALVFKAGGGSVPIKVLQLKTTSTRTPLTAKVGGSQLKLAEAKDLAVSRQGFDEKVKVSSLTLSAKLATRLAKKLHRRGVFEEGLPLGRTLTVAKPQTVALLGQGRAELALAPGFAAKLGSLFVAVNPIFPAEHIGSMFTLPIFGGDIAPGGLQGAVETSGSLEFLQLGGGQIFWAESRLDLTAKTFGPEVDVEPSPPFGGKIGRLSVAALLAGSVSNDPKQRTIAVQGAELSLQAATAQTFNEVFAKPQGKDGVFLAGEPLGVISFVAQGQ